MRLLFCTVSAHPVEKCVYLSGAPVCLPAALLLCGLVRAQQLLLPGSCSFELGTCGYTSDPDYGGWIENEEGTELPLNVLIEGWF